MNNYIFLILLIIIGCDNNTLIQRDDVDKKYLDDIQSVQQNIEDIKISEDKNNTLDNNFTKNIENLFSDPRYKYKLDGRGNVVDGYGNIIAVNATLDPYYNIIGTYVATLVEKLRRKQYVILENEQNVKINITTYHINASLNLDNSLKVGFSYRVYNNFFGKLLSLMISSSFEKPAF